MILVTGATGTVGSELVRLLVEQGLAVRAMTRDPSRVRMPGVEAVRGDFADRTLLDRAVAGASAFFLLTAPGKPVADHDLAMLDAARSAGVGRVVKLSAIGGGAIDDGQGGTAGVGTWSVSGSPGRAGWRGRCCGQPRSRPIR